MYYSGEITTTSNPNIPMQAGSDNAITSTRGKRKHCDIINLPG